MGISDTIHVVLGFTSIWHGCFARRSQQEQKKTFDPICNVISDVTDEILQHIRKVQARIYQMPFLDRESTQKFDS